MSFPPSLVACVLSMMLSPLTSGKLLILDPFVEPEDIDLSLMLDYGYNIPTTCGKVQEKVKSTVENMTGLNVTDVNVRIASVDMNKQK